MCMASLLIRINYQKGMNMKAILFLWLSTFVLFSCNENSNDKGGEKDPSTVHPPSEAIPDSTKLVDDSVIMPDVTPGNGSQVGNSDSINRNR